MSTISAAPLVQTVVWPPEPLTLQVSEPRAVSWLAQAAMSDAGASKPSHMVAEMRDGATARRVPKSMDRGENILVSFGVMGEVGEYGTVGPRV